MNEKQTQKCRCCESPDVGSFDAHDQARAAQRRAIENFHRSAQGGCLPVGSAAIGGHILAGQAPSPADRVKAAEEAWRSADREAKRAEVRWSGIHDVYSQALKSVALKVDAAVVGAEIVKEHSQALSHWREVADRLDAEWKQAKKEAETHG